MSETRPIDRPLNPDCWSGKHHACRGDAWSATEDRLCDCCCECHTEPSARGEQS